MLLHLLTLLGLANGGYKCHCSPCSCQEIQGYVWVDCSYRQLSRVPSTLPWNTTHLDLSNNNLGFGTPFGGAGLSELRNFTQLEELRLNNNHLVILGIDLSHLPSLKKLILDRNGMFFVNTAAFRGLPRLRELSLTQNTINHINPTLLSDLVSLEHFDISNNRIQVVTNEMFSNQAKLKTLNLQNNNIYQLYEGTLSNCPRLVSLKLDDNVISTLPRGLFSNSVRLKEIYLARNKLMFVLSWTFRHLYNLEVLDLSNNSIIQIDPIPSAWNLRVFDLSGNRLRSLPMETLYEMKNSRTTVLGVYGNMLDCVPRFLSRFLSYMRTTNVTLTMRSNIKCASPENLEGQVIGRFQCPIKGALFSICAPLSDKYCTSSPDIIEGAQCVARCACPEHRPLVVSGTCQTGSACIESVSGICARHRISSLFPQTSSYIPSCDPEGLYRPLQCNGKVCWCVNKQGMNVRSDFKQTHSLTDEVCVISNPTAMPRTCAVWGNGRVLQFDGTILQIKTDCYYSLASDISHDSKFNIYTRLSQCSSSPLVTCVASVLLFVKRRYPILITSDLNIYTNGSMFSVQEGQSLMLIWNQIKVTRSSDLLSLEYVNDGVTVVFGGWYYLTVNIGQNHTANRLEYDITGACGTVSTNDVNEPLQGLAMIKRWKLIRSCSDPVLVPHRPLTGTDPTCSHLTSYPFNTCTLPSLNWGRMCSEDNNSVVSTGPAMFCATASLYAQLCADQGVIIELSQSNFYLNNC